MRIRKRQVSFPLLPATLSSDPHLINPSPVMVQLNDVTTTTSKPSCTHVSATAPISLSDHPQLSNQLLLPIGKRTDGFDDLSGDAGAYKRQQKKQVEDGIGEEGGEGQKGNDSRKRSILCSEMEAEIFSPSRPSSIKQDERWCDVDKAFPLKKRRGSFENVIEETSNDNSKKKMRMKNKMKTKMNKKCLEQDDSNEGDDEDEDYKEEEVVIKETTKPDVNVGKKRVRGGALMEGSRCSRVNGRGWRCCQQTLVGYSLCEHHLGKGRLRSMTSVRSRSIATTTTNAAPKNNNLQDIPFSEPSSSIPEKQTTGVNLPDINDNDEKKPSIITKKRMKLGMVKARSISSLLGQTTKEIAIAENNK